jgi:hypothetical protein
MSNRLFQSRAFSLNREGKLVSLLYQANAASAPIMIQGKGWKTLTHTATGVITCVLQDGYYKLLGFKLTPAFSALTATLVQLGGINVTSTATGVAARTVIINYFTSTTGAAVDIAANAANLISLDLWVQNEK